MTVSLYPESKGDDELVPEYVSLLFSSESWSSFGLLERLFLQRYSQFAPFLRETEAKYQNRHIEFLLHKLITFSYDDCLTLQQLVWAIRYCFQALKSLLRALQS